MPSPTRLSGFMAGTTMPLVRNTNDAQQESGS